MRHSAAFSGLAAAVEAISMALPGLTLAIASQSAAELAEGLAPAVGSDERRGEPAGSDVDPARATAVESCQFCV